VLAGGVGEHRLLERGERPRLDDVGGDGAGQTGEDERRQPGGQGEGGARERHDDEQQPVAAAAPEPVAVTGDQHGDERDACEQRGENETDCRVGEAAVGER
jgi:hypothetical protein